MSKEANPFTTEKTTLQRLTGRLIDSKFIKWVSNVPPIAWATRLIVRTLLRRRMGVSPAQNVVLSKSGRANLEENLQSIVYDVVMAHGYLGAMLATYEQGDDLPVRAFYVNPETINMQDIYRIETEVSKFTPQPVSITDPTIARVNRYNPAHQNNLSVRAVNAGAPIISDSLYDLVRPIAPPASEQVIRGFQEALGMRQAIAVPFFLETYEDGKNTKEIVGNLFAIKSEPITERDMLALSAFGRQAAAAIEAERRRLHSKVAQDLVYAMQTNLQNEDQILQQIAEGVVTDLGYAGAMVGTYESNNSIPVRAFYINPNVASMDDIERMETEVSKYTPSPISITDPQIARVYRYEPAHQDNLSVRAVEAGEPVTSDDLYDLLRPIAPEASKQVIKAIQEELNIKQVIAVPFFLETLEDGVFQRETVGNLFAATRSKSFSLGEIETLNAFGQQAAAGIHNARLYKKAESRRQVAETFGRMAFSATANLHELRNHVGVFKNYLEVLQRLIGQHEIEEKNFHLIKEMLKTNPDVIRRMQSTLDILDNLHEPFRHISDSPTDVNTCLKMAIEKAAAKVNGKFINFNQSLADNLPEISTSPDMLIEAFAVILKNAVDAVESKGKEKDRNIWVRSKKRDGDILVTIEDNGTGIKPEHMDNIFELEWSTKDVGMGFGLYWTKDFIEGIDGVIQVDSQVGAGTTFTITLPLN